MMAETPTRDDVLIHYEIEGRADGPPLIFSNSLGTDLRMWDGQAKEAAGRGFRVIRYDQRGHGKSAAPEGDYTLSRLGEDVIDLLDALEIERAAFCGLSMGGMTGMWLAKHRPRRFSLFALCNTSTRMPPVENWNARIKAVREGGMEAVVDRVLGLWFTPEFAKRAPAEVDRIRSIFLATDPGGYVGCCAAVRDMDERDRLGTIEAPVFVVIGAHDPSTTPEMGQYIVEHIPGAQKAVLDSAHLSNIERPDDFNRIVLGFLAGGQPRGQPRGHQ
jgi:3-oxoadipate enol-lactonase